MRGALRAGSSRAMRRATSPAPRTARRRLLGTKRMCAASAYMHVLPARLKKVPVAVVRAHMASEKSRGGVGGEGADGTCDARHMRRKCSPGGTHAGEGSHRTRS